MQFFCPGVTISAKILFGGKQRGYINDLGVCEYQKVENRCFKGLIMVQIKKQSKLFYSDFWLSYNGIRLV